jgi:PIN domain nuclease of toxin-antitoxin system
VIVLDASAVLCMLFREPGFDKVAAQIDDACISAINLAEVLGRFVRDGHDLETVRTRIERLSLPVVDFDRVQAAIAASLVRRCRSAGLSLGDRACLALAIHKRLPAMTADRAWRDLDHGVEVVIVR